MIVVRDIFRIRFGQSKPAIDLWKQAMAVLHRHGFKPGQVRLLTDLAGPDYYTLILESTHDSLTTWEQSSTTLRANAEWKTLYQQIIPLTEHGRREILTVVG